MKELKQNRLEIIEVRGSDSENLATNHYKNHCTSCKHCKDGWCSVGRCDAKCVLLCSNYAWRGMTAREKKNLHRRKSWKEFQKLHAERYLKYASTEALEDEIRKRKNKESKR